MKISRVRIQNFKSIIDLEFFPNNLCALIGPNSAGKTNILKALDLILGEGWATKAKVARELFNDISKPILIEVEFTTPISYSTPREIVEVNKIELTFNFEPELFAKTTINDGQNFYYQDIFKKNYHFIYIPSIRDLKDEMRVSQWTLLGKLMKLVYDNYCSNYDNEEELKSDFETVIQPAKEFLEADFNPGVVTFRKFSDVFKKYCIQNSGGLAQKFIPRLDIYNLNWFYKTLQISIEEENYDKVFDAEQVGSGMQNLILISIFQTYSELIGGRVIFGIEEPEMFLYPHAQRALYESFRELSENTQIFYTTHNANFVDAFYASEIELVRKNPEMGTIILDKSELLNPENAERFRHRIYSQFNNERNELFFAKFIILVEGNSDKILWTILITEKWNIDINNYGISIIECGGKGGVNYFIGICELMGIDDYFAIWDEDDELTDVSLDYLSKAREKEKYFEVPGNLEKFLSLPTSSEADKIKNAYEWAKQVDESSIPEEFEVIHEHIISSLGIAT